MATLSVRLPESVHRKLVELAKKEGVSLNQLLSSAAAEKLAALMAEEYLANRAERGSRRQFRAVLAKAPKRPPHVGDELPGEYVKRPRKKVG
jgi:predicted transcriptional regulator